MHAVMGAKPRDSGRWSCEVGSNSGPRAPPAKMGHWALVGELDIEVQEAAKLLEGRRETLTGAIQASTTLLVICVVVFCIFLSILVSVVIMYGRSRLRQRSAGTREAILREEEPRQAGTAGDFLKRVLPHIIKFPIRENQTQ